MWLTLILLVFCHPFPPHKQKFLLHDMWRHDSFVWQCLHITCKHVYKASRIPYYVTLLWLTIVSLLICNFFQPTIMYWNVPLSSDDSVLPTPSPPPVFDCVITACWIQGRPIPQALPSRKCPSSTSTPNFLHGYFPSCKRPVASVF